MSDFSISKALVKMDRFCDYVPFVSTVSSLVDIFEKAMIQTFCSDKTIKENRYFSHINGKSNERSAILLIPILGNIIVALGDMKIKNTVQDLKSLMDELKKSFEEFKSFLNNPQKPIELNIFGVKVDTEGWSRLGILNTLWGLNLGLKISGLSLAMSLMELKGLNENQKIDKQMQEFDRLKTELLQTRQSFYPSYLQSLEKEELIREAKMHLLASEQMTVETLISKLQEKKASEETNEFRLLELNSVISQLKKLQGS